LSHARHQADLFTATEARDQALARVIENSGDWSETMLEEISAIRSGMNMTGEELRLYLLNAVGWPPHHHNAWGGLIAAAVKRRLLIPTGKWRHMATVKSHARKTPEYVRA